MSAQIREPDFVTEKSIGSDQHGQLEKSLVGFCLHGLVSLRVDVNH